MDMLRVTVVAVGADVVGLVESWANESIPDAELTLEGFDMYRRDRETGNRGGGVLLYVKTDLRSTEWQPKSDYPEHVWCKVKDRKNREIKIGVVYRTCNTRIYGGSLHDRLMRLMTELKDDSVLVMGDFNYAGINWESHGVDSAAPVECEEFRNCLDKCFLTQHVTVPTREDKTLDLVITTDHDSVSDVKVVDRLEKSDHNMIHWSYHLEADREDGDESKYFDYKRANYEAMKAKLGETNWEVVLQGDANQDWILFKERVLELEKQYVPIRLHRVKKKNIWMTRKAVEAVNKKRQIYSRYRQDDHPAVKKANAKAKKAVKKAKKNFEKKLAANIKKDNKSFYAYVRNKSRSKIRPGVVEDAAGQEVTSEEKIADEFNRYFSTVFTKESDESPTPMNIFEGAEEDKLTSLTIDEDMVLGKLRKLREDKSTGVDNLSPRLLVGIGEAHHDYIW